MSAPTSPAPASGEPRDERPVNPNPVVRHVAASAGERLNVLGCRIVPKTHCLDRDDASFVFECSLPSGLAVPLHTHAQWESFYVLEGTVEFGRLVDGEPNVITARPGDLITVEGGAPHSFQNVGPTEARLLVIGEPDMEPFFYAAGDNVPAGLPSDDEISRVVKVMLAHGQHILGPHPQR